VIVQRKKMQGEQSARAARDSADGGGKEVSREAVNVQRGARHDQPKVITALHDFLHEAKEDISVDGTLMRLIKDDN
jgi:hypothetical protein